MKKVVILGIFLATSLGLSLTACGGAAPAEPVEEESSEPVDAPAAESHNAGISVEEAFASASMPNGAVYMTLLNEGDGDDTLVSAETDVAETVELHETTMDENEVMRMSPVEGGVAIPAGGSTTLEPGGLHVMLIGLREELAPGDAFALTLNFEQAGSQTIEVEVTEGMSMDHDEMEESEMDHDEMEEGEMEEGEMEEGEMEEGEMEEGEMSHEEEEMEEGE